MGISKRGWRSLHEKLSQSIDHHVSNAMNSCRLDTFTDQVRVGRRGEPEIRELVAKDTIDFPREYCDHENADPLLGVRRARPVWKRLTLPPRSSSRRHKP